ncbi:error-prone DNA polymerase [Nannocystis pusilla]|uniref:error-prone DNA polymerase n=1 Tax=Nannocystis pusilla TaxID=889268 RepID=UPI003BF3B85D
MTVRAAALWVKSNFSFLEGASHPDELVNAAHAHGLQALALTDRDGVYGLVRAHVAAQKLGLPVITGAQVTIGDPDDLLGVAPEAPPDDPEEHVLSDMPHEAYPKEHAPSSMSKQPAAKRPATSPPKQDRRGRPAQRPRPVAPPPGRPLLLLAPTRAAYADLCRLLSRGRMSCPKGHSRVRLADLPEHGRELVALALDPDMLPALREPFAGRLYALVARHREAAEAPLEARLRAAAELLDVPVVAGTEVLYHDAARRPLQDVLTCIRRNISLAQAGAQLRANAEHDLKSPAQLAALFRDDPAALARTLEVAERCTFSLAELRYRYPGGELPDGTSGSAWLRELTFRGARERYRGDVPPAVAAQLDRELALIDELDYGGYFLTMWELVQFCRSQQILCQGRGSAANSAVCFCLGITAIDPVRMDLLFERFISRERAEPPDIDLDIEHERREEVIQHVYQRYGRRNAAMVATFIRYRPRSAIRDVGKALGAAPDLLDRAAKLQSAWGAEFDVAMLKSAGVDPDIPLHGHLLRLSREILDFPRHAATHPGGFLLGHDPVDTLCPIEPAAMVGRTIVQWDKNDVEDLGLFKVDLLGLGALAQVRRALELIRVHHGRELSMATIPAEDPATYDMLCAADTVGVFQIESRAQMAMLPRLRPKTFYDLVIEVAIVRPGPIQGDMVHPYLRRRTGEEPTVYPHPSLERVLAKTLGVPLFQEQVMRLAMLAADYTPGEADQLRRDMAAWRSPGRIEPHHDRIVERMANKGIDRAFAERVFAQIRGFGEYGFPESHAASFALIAYATAWLRRHYPAAFTCALLNAQPMGFYHPSTLVADAQRHGIEVRPIDVRQSAWDCTLEHDPEDSSKVALRMGLRYVKGLGVLDRAALEGAPPPYASLDEFARRTRLSAPALHALAEAGALIGFGLDRRAALWRVRGLAAARGDALALPEAAPPPAQQTLFTPLTAGEAVLWDYRRTHHSTRGHPLSEWRPALRRLGIEGAAAVARLPGGTPIDYVGAVTCRQRPPTAGGVTFYTLEDETGMLSVIVWASVYERYGLIGRTAQILGVSGRLQREQGVLHLIADTLWDPRSALG